MPTQSLDLSALTDPFDLAAARATAARLRATQQTTQKPGTVLLIVDVGVGIVFGLALLVMVPVFIGQVVQLATSEFRPQVTPVLVIGVFILGIVAYLWLSLHRYFSTNRDIETWWRLQRLADANDFIFSPWSPNPAYPSKVFHAGEDIASYNHVRARDGLFFDIGNLFTHTGKNDAETFDRRWGFVAIALERPLQQMILDASSNGRIAADLPLALSSQEVLSLEGDFDDYFTLYCPPSGERDALFIFTPDLMALLIDSVSTLDVEINGQWMFLYSDQPFDMKNAALVEHLLRIVDVVGSKTRDRSRRFFRSNNPTGTPRSPGGEGIRALTLRQRYPRLKVYAVLYGSILALFAAMALGSLLDRA